MRTSSSKISNLSFADIFLNKKSRKALLSTTALIAAGAMFIPGTAKAVDDYADWDDVEITNGDASVTDTGLGKTEIEQHSMRAIGEAQELHIGTMGEVTINQGSKDALFVGRVVGDHSDPTQILGKLSADGRVMIIDRNGVFFGAGSRVDAAGIAVSTGDVSDDSIMSGSEELTFENFGDGEIVMEGTINVSDAGLAAFVSPTIKNSGVINAKMGNVVMASGEKVTLDMYGDGLVEVAVEGDLGKTLIENKGRIEAEGGTIQLTTQAAKDVIDSVVNNEGIISASSATMEGGKIVLSGGDVKVSGTVDASGTTGGDVSITGQNVEIASAGAIKNTGTGGNTYVYGDKKATFKGTLETGTNSTSEISGHELELGGTITAGEGSSISFDPATLVVNAGEAATFVSALNNNGVTVNVEAQDQITVNADIDSSAQSTNSTLNFKDEDANNDLQVDLNAKIKLGSNQNLTGEATEVNVANTASIQNGVDISASGAEVNVAAGTYNESVTVDRSLTLNGANAGVSGDGVRGAESKIVTGSAGILVTADNVTVDGFEIEGGKVGIQVKDADNALLKNNYIHGQFDASAEGDSEGGLATGDGIYVENSDGTTIERNLIADYNDDGVQARNVSNILVSRNVINDNGNGDQGVVIARARGDVKVMNNTITNARRDGVQFVDVRGEPRVRGNTITGSGHSGVSLVNAVSTHVDDNIIDGGVYGVDVVNSRRVAVGDQDANNNSGNTITNVGTGVKVSSSEEVAVQDNAISDVVTGVQVNNSDQILIQANEIDASGNGVRFVDGIIGDKRMAVYDNVINAGENGILIEGGIKDGSIVNLGAEGLGNTIVAGEDGIRVDGRVKNSRLRITDSNITGGDDGIQVQKIGKDGVVAVWYNDSIVGQGGSGIDVHKISATPEGGLSVVGNLLIDGAEDGITLHKVKNSNVVIVDNDLIRGQRHGINFAGKVKNSEILIGDDGVDIFDSVITGVTGDGIHFDKKVKDSTITVGAGTLSVTTTGATTTYTTTALNGVTINSGNDGIGFEGPIVNSDLFFVDNTIDAGDNGMEFLGSVTDTDITVAGNTIDAGNDGIDFDNSVINSNILIGSALGYVGNIINSVQSGIEFGKSGIAVISDVVIDILNNTINAGVHGVALDYNLTNTDVTITGNDIVGARRGVSVANGDLVNTTFDISNNTRIEGTTEDGILIQDLVLGGASATVSGNGDPVLLTGGITGGDDGVDMRNIENVTIKNNYVHDAAVDGIKVLTTSNANISGNYVERSGANGVDLRNAALATVANNTLDRNSTGLYILGSSSVDILDNTLSNNILYGMHADGTGNGALKLAGNVFLDNPTGARFESGQIDLTDTFNPNSFIVSSGFAAPTVVGMQFDGAPTVLTITGETLGATIFEGYGARPVGSSYYVRFEDGSILDPVTNLPILIDGQFASWDGIVPNTFGGFLSSTQYQDIEDRLYDADDIVVDGRGQIFVGEVTPPPPVDPNDPDADEDVTLLEIQDFFREFETPTEQVNRASVRVLGLPPIGLLNNQFSLANISPAAGEEAPAGTSTGTPENLASITPAAGEGAANASPASIEPQAGEQEATCWDDALTSLETGAVTYNFGGTFEDSIAAESRCSTSQQGT